ncbi:MAG: nucleotide exchange factor GrpE [Gemmatimonadales bacterium]
MPDSVRDDEDLEGEVATEAGAGEGSPEAGDVVADREVDEARRRLEELNDKHLRLVAEFSNYRRRTEQERLSAWGRAQAEVISKFLDVLDDLHRVAQLDLENATVDNIMEGIDLVERKFSRMLEDAGVETIDPLGMPFDPQEMEAITRVPAEKPEQDDTVAQVMQKGYALKGTLMRPARVAVYKHG